MSKVIRITCFIAILVSCLYPDLYGQSYAEHGMVVSDNAVASQVGVDILKSGGNAIDASVATAFALAVTHPQAGNIGGGGFLVYMDNAGETTTIDFREKAPLKATKEMFLDKKGALISGSNHEGALSIGVPGTVAGLYLAHQKYGVLPWRKIVQPAVDLAEKGVPLSYTLYRHGQYFSNKRQGSFLDSYFRNATGQRIGVNEIWKQPELAATLKQIRDKGKDGFYKGKVAKRIVAFMKENGGIISKKDLAQYQAIERKALKGTYKGFDIYTMPPPSSGGVALIEMLNLVEQANPDSIPFNSASYVHFIAETMKRAFADRAEFLGDPDFNPDMPVDRLTSKSFAQKRYNNMSFNKASVSDSSRFGQLYDGNSTTHFSVMDNKGNAVSTTYTLEYSYGSGLGSKELGFIFNNEMGDFNPYPGHTNAYGLIGTPANQIAPEKRMLSSMSPTIVAKDGVPVLIIGSPGGRTIINTVFQAVLNVLEYKMPLKKAIETMKVHHQWLPNVLVYESDLMSPDTVEKLKEMGHTVEEVAQLGRLMGIAYDPVLQVIIGVSDSSSPDGGAVGY